MLSEKLNYENAELVCQGIIDSLREGASTPAFEYDFHLNPHSLKMLFDEEMLENELDQWESNTNFQFDTQVNKESHKTIISIIDSIKNQEEISVDEELLFVDFLKDVRGLLNDKYNKEISNIIREKALRQKEESAPLSIVKVINVEIGPLPDPSRGEGSAYLISVQKAVEKSNFNKSGNVSADLTSRFEQTGKHPDEIVKERHESNDPLYKDVISASLKKFVFEVRIDLFVDYSLSKPANETTSNVSA